MIKLTIPGFGPLEIRRVVTDYTGTHSFKGVVRRSVRTRLARLARLVEVHVLTVDTFGTVRCELARLPVELHFLDNDRRNDKEKQRFVLKYGPKHVAAFGSGTIDRLLLKTVRDAGGLAVAVDNGEGCALDAILNANMFVHGSEQALHPMLSDRLSVQAGMVSPNIGLELPAPSAAAQADRWVARMAVLGNFE